MNDTIPFEKHWDYFDQKKILGVDAGNETTHFI